MERYEREREQVRGAVIRLPSLSPRRVLRGLCNCHVIRETLRSGRKITARAIGDGIKPVSAIDLVNGLADG